MTRAMSRLAVLRVFTAALLVLPVFGFAPPPRLGSLQEEENKSVRWSEEELKHSEAIPARGEQRTIPKRTITLVQTVYRTPARGYATDEPHSHEQLDLRNGAGISLLC